MHLEWRRRRPACRPRLCAWVEETQPRRPFSLALGVDHLGGECEPNTRSRTRSRAGTHRGRTRSRLEHTCRSTGHALPDLLGPRRESHHVVEAHSKAAGCGRRDGGLEHFEGVDLSCVSPRRGYRKGGSCSGERGRGGRGGRGGRSNRQGRRPRRRPSCVVSAVVG